jgi:ABC-type nitrate/sulfonate/bicarbonate transport system permease component
MNATPRVALLPLVIIWLGIGILSKVGIIVINSLRTSRKFLSKSS